MPSLKLVKLYRTEGEGQLRKSTGIRNNLVQMIHQYKKYRYFFILLLPALIHKLIFDYAPMYGVIIAFKQFRIREGIFGSAWVGFDHFKNMFTGTYDFFNVLSNTIEISLLKLIFVFPASIIVALLLNEIGNSTFKKVTQTISYLPHFLSWVMIAGLLRMFLSPSTGLVNGVIKLLGGAPIYFLANSRWFRSVLIVSDIWQSAGWGSIIYLAAITNIDVEMYQAAIIDGANKFKQAVYITIPSIVPIMTIMLILSVGNILDAGFGQIFNLFSPVVYDVADILDTYVYRVGMVEMNYSFSAAVGLFKNVVGLILVIITNQLAKTFGEYGIW